MLQTEPAIFVCLICCLLQEDLPSEVIFIAVFVPCGRRNIVYPYIILVQKSFGRIGLILRRFDTWSWRVMLTNREHLMFYLLGGVGEKEAFGLCSNDSWVRTYDIWYFDPTPFNRVPPKPVLGG